MKKKNMPIINRIEVDEKSGEPTIVELSQKEMLLLEEAKDKARNATKEEKKATTGKQLKIADEVLDADKAFEKRKKRLKTIVTILFFAFCFGVVIFTAVSDFKNPIDWTKLASILSQNWVYIICTILTVSVFFLSKGLQRSCFCKSITKKWHLKTSLSAGIICQLYNNLTPLAVGGQPFEVHHFATHGLNGGEASSVPIMSYIINMFSATMISLIAVILFKTGLINGKIAEIGAALNAVFIMSIIGLIANLCMPILVVLFAVSPKLCSKLIYFVIFIGKKLKLVKNPELLKYKLLRSVIINAKCIKSLFKKPLVLMSTTLLSVLEMLAKVSIAYFVLLTFGYQSEGIHTWLQIVVVGLIMQNAVAIIPTPGNAGAIDLSFYGVFSVLLIDGAKFPAMMLWRCFDFYLIIVFGLIFVRILKSRDRKLELKNKIQEFK